MRAFDHFVAIDWSGAKGGRQRGIAVAICAADGPGPRLIERAWSRAAIVDWLRDELPANSLVGLDLSPGLPFHDQGRYFPGWDRSPPDARALWALVDAIAQDEPHLGANAFVEHPEARRHFRHGRGDCGDLFSGGGGRLRLTELSQKAHRLAPSSCFNLVGAAQVGKSSLTGMRVLHRLAGALPVWPFDPVPASGSLIVEIYTSLAAREAGVPAGRSKFASPATLAAALGKYDATLTTLPEQWSDHAADALLTAAWLRRAAAKPALWAPDGLEPVRATEGWTFGVA